MQHEQTEIDALAALRPEDLRSIALDAIKPFYDHTLETRSHQARSQWYVEAQRQLIAHPDYQAEVTNIRDALVTLEEAADAFHDLQNSAVHTLQGIELPPIIAPELMIDAAPPPPLFTTDDNYIIASHKLKSHKALGKRMMSGGKIRRYSSCSPSLKGLPCFTSRVYNLLG
jgi:hypothetical protein